MPGEEDTMPYGLMLYGFKAEDAGRIIECIAPKLNGELIAISAAGLEKQRVQDIIGSGGSKNFFVSETKIMMFMGFNQNEVQMVLEDFGDFGVERPIFCALTPHNYTWILSDMISHLQEEHRQWGGRNDSS